MLRDVMSAVPLSVDPLTVPQLTAIIVISLLGFGLYMIVAHQSPNGSSSTAQVQIEAPLSGPATPSRQYAILLDVSESRPEAMISEGRQFIDAVVDKMNYGDRLVLLEMYEAGVKDVEPDPDMTINEAEDVTSLDEKERLDGSRKGVKGAVALFFQNAAKKRVVHTDIFTTLSIASEKLRPQKGNCLILLSDMLQSSKEFEFEHLLRMPQSGWIDEQNRRGLIRPLYSSSVVVVGADPSTHEGVIVRDFWQKYFARSDALLKMANYRTTPPSDASVCE
jgi:hypothetical protein